MCIDLKHDKKAHLTAVRQRSFLSLLPFPALPYATPKNRFFNIFVFFQFTLRQFLEFFWWYFVFFVPEPPLRRNYALMSETVFTSTTPLPHRPPPSFFLFVSSISVLLTPHPHSFIIPPSHGGTHGRASNQTYACGTVVPSYIAKTDSRWTRRGQNGW